MLKTSSNLLKALEQDKRVLMGTKIFTIKFLLVNALCIGFKHLKQVCKKSEKIELLPVISTYLFCNI
jgi:hypothetical protein